VPEAGVQSGLVAVCGAAACSCQAVVPAEALTQRLSNTFVSSGTGVGGPCLQARVLVGHFTMWVVGWAFAVSGHTHLQANTSA
jgi:hypothetical protein